jgi:hypothetical protein
MEEANWSVVDWGGRREGRPGYCRKSKNGSIGSISISSYLSSLEATLFITSLAVVPLHSSTSLSS